MKSKRSTDHNIRTVIAKDYTQAIKKKTSCSCKKPIPKGAVAKLAGYSNQELCELPPEAIVNSFGCGNPTAFANLQQGDIVLDLGAGAGIDLLLAARKIGPTGKAIGIDMTDAMIAKAQKNIRASKMSNIEVHKGIIENLPIANNSIDWVISNCVINLSPEKNKVFKEIFRVLKPGGKMLVSDIVAKRLPPAIVTHPQLYSSCLAGAISEKNYIAGLKKTGFTKIKAQDRLFYSIEQLENFICSEIQNNSICKCELTKLKALIAKLLNKVWSIKVFAVKPIKIKSRLNR